MSPRGTRPARRRPDPSAGHPRLKAALLMIGVVAAIVVLSALPLLTGR
jgi:hypothetical protein